jgi:hypothetical protein
VGARGGWVHVRGDGRGGGNARHHCRYVDFNGVLKNITGSHVGKHKCYTDEHDATLRRMAVAINVDVSTFGSFGVLGNEIPAVSTSDNDAISSVPGKDSGEIIVERGGGGMAATGSATGSVTGAPIPMCPPCNGCPACPVSSRATPPQLCKVLKSQRKSEPQSWGQVNAPASFGVVLCCVVVLCVLCVLRCVALLFPLSCS